MIKAERRLFGPDGGKGMMFTNGTGTGKTFTGLGIVNRQFRAGKKNVLIVVPTDQKAKDWIEEAGHMDLPVSQLGGTKDAGKDVVVTTYANFRQNDALNARIWDLIVYDESHKLNSNQAGGATAAQKRHRQLACVPTCAFDRAKEMSPEQKTLDEKIYNYASGLMQYDLWEERQRAAKAHFSEEQEELDKKHYAEARKLHGKTKAIFLSATPFAYHKSLEYADGCLFDIMQSEKFLLHPDERKPENPQGLSYNEPDSYESFFVKNFGYRMRYNKLTQPESGVDANLMERMFHENMKKRGVLSGRKLVIDRDYSRHFVLLDSQIGKMINDGMEIVLGFKDYRENEWRELYNAVQGKYTFIYQSQLLESVKASASLERIRKHLALGRKVIVFHNYIGKILKHPFDFSDLRPRAAGDEKEVIAARDQLIAEIEAFHKKYPQYGKLDLGELGRPVDIVMKAFPGRCAQFNGTAKKADRSAAVKKFNRPDSKLDILLVQIESGKEGISLHDRGGDKPRVVYSLGLPYKPTDAIQMEGRAYRTGNRSDAIFEYPVIHTNLEKYAFGTKIKERVKTAENLAMGEAARNLEEAFKEGYANPTEADPDENQGAGGKESDQGAELISEFDKAKTFYFARQKKTSRNKAREGKDYFATPEPLGLKMVEWANPKPNDKMLEPSAGHGAIGRFFPGDTTNTFIEQSPELAAELNIYAPGDVKQQDFEDLNVVNKYDCICMNPPFGAGGRTAVDHLIKACSHLRNGGRVLCILPDGPACQKKFDKWFEDEEAGKNLYLSAEIGLPACTFERAGTKVKARIVVIDRYLNPEDAPAFPVRRELDAADINDLFDKIMDMEIPGRKMPTKPKEAAAEDYGDASDQDDEIQWYDGSIPREWAERFDNIGIIAKRNREDIEPPGNYFRGRFYKGKTIEAESRYLFQDKAYGGPLYKKKDDFKKSFGARFFNNKQGKGGFKGAWWHVEARNELEEIFNLLS